MEEHEKIEDNEHLETLQEDSGIGSISINNDVVANIVAMAAKEVPGVSTLASGGIKDDIAGLFGSRRDSGSAVSIREEADGTYHIQLKVILIFGVQLAKVAQSVQVSVRDQVENMTNKDVSRVDIIVDGVRKEQVGGDEEDED